MGPTARALSLQQPYRAPRATIQRWDHTWTGPASNASTGGGASPLLSGMGGTENPTDTCRASTGAAGSPPFHKEQTPPRKTSPKQPTSGSEFGFRHGRLLGEWRVTKARDPFDFSFSRRQPG